MPSYIEDHHAEISYEWRNPSCHDCGEELFDEELGNKQGDVHFCDSCWHGYDWCLYCEEPIIGEQVNLWRLVPETGKYETYHFHSSCKPKWDAEQEESNEQ